MDAQVESAFPRVASFVFDLGYEDLPEATREMAALLLLDTLGVAVAAQDLEAARIARETAVQLYGAGPGAPKVRMLTDGRTVSVAGAAYAGATQVDNLDAHDGYNPAKGHVGAALIPALVSLAQTVPAISGREALALTAIGYEIGSRAGVVLHDTVSDYHTSGSWNALAVAAIGARLRGLSRAQLRQAIGIAEYHGPRSQMMREIDNPTMLHDGSGWGALGATSAVMLAEQGFTGAPAVTVEAPEVAGAWHDLGQTWLTEQQYIKPYPICRWAHAPIDAALTLRQKHGLSGEDVAAVEIVTFAESARLFAGMPESSPVAQYSLAFAVAMALVHGRVGVAEITGDSLGDPAAARLVAATSVQEADLYNARFPAGRWGEVTLILKDGQRLESGATNARGGPDGPLRSAEIRDKFMDFAGPVIGRARAEALERAVLGLVEPEASFDAVIDLATAAP